MIHEQFQTITSTYSRLRIAILGDFCLDRYLEIDPARAETSIETGLAVHNVVNVRAQPGAAGTVLNNLVALGIGTIFPVGFAGDDGEGFELRRELGRLPGVRLDYFLQTPLRRTFTYCKPLVLEKGAPPRELNRLDSKNWTPTPAAVESHFGHALRALEHQLDALIVMDQVDLAQTGVVTTAVLRELDSLAHRQPNLLVLADSRRGLHGYPPVSMKMNRVELGMLLSCPPPEDIEQVRSAAAELAKRNNRYVFVTLAERGLLGAAASGEVQYFPSLPLRGPIDIVGAGDSVSANLTAALAAGASLAEALQLANAAASIVIHQLGTTGTASIPQLSQLLTQPH
jgi:rfaE bifunctional protein kinase chain/domain